MKKILVFGLARTGISALKTLKLKGYELGAIDDNIDDEKSKILKELEVKVETIDTIEDYNIILKSPGIRLDNPVIVKANELNIEVVSDLELAQRIFDDIKIVAITGTNGKTTTTSLMTKMLNDSGRKAISIGNIGVGMLWEIYNSDKDTFFVIECSSFQLESTKNFKPQYSCIINITPDHIDWHGSMQNYVNAKKKILKNQDKKCFAVLNSDDEYFDECKNTTNANVYEVSTKKEVKKGAFIKDDSIYYSDSSVQKIIELKDVKLIGYHNYQNVLFCVSLAKLIGIDNENIKKTLMSFSGVEHRLEFVREIQGVKYYNDSKGTNVDASVKAIDSFDNNIIILAGGYDKKVSLDNFFIAGKNKFKAIILMGQTRELFKEKALQYGFKNIFLVDNMKQAVEKANELSEKNDTVLLSPASASWGMYNNYEERGNEFKELVNKL